MRNGTITGASQIHGIGVFAVEPFKPNDLMAVVTGTISSAPAPGQRRISVQIAAGEHFVPDSIIDYINHSCQANAYLEYENGNIRIIASKPVSEGEEITFDYCTTELEIGHPFNCGCGSTECLTLVRGFKYLTRPAKAKRMKQAMNYLREMSGMP